MLNVYHQSVVVVVVSVTLFYTDKLCLVSKTMKLLVLNGFLFYFSVYN